MSSNLRTALPRSSRPRHPLAGGPVGSRERSFVAVPGPELQALQTHTQAGARPTPTPGPSAENRKSIRKGNAGRGARSHPAAAGTCLQLLRSSPHPQLAADAAPARAQESPRCAHGTRRSAPPSARCSFVHPHLCCPPGSRTGRAKPLLPAARCSGAFSRPSWDALLRAQRLAGRWQQRDGQSSEGTK